MSELRLGFKAFDAHELLCHFLAVRSRAYERAGLRVSLLDTTFIPDEQLPANVVHVACGAALAAWVRGAPLSVLCVATDRPMFWLYGRTNPGSLSSLRGARIATFSAPAPPAQFLNLLLRDAGLDTAKDVRLHAARDDMARLGLLTAGEVEVALVSSALPPAEMQHLGFVQIACVGDLLRVPTTGLAASRALIDSQRGALEKLVHAFAHGLALLARDSSAARGPLEEIFRVPARSLSATCELMQRYFTADGRSSAQITAGAGAVMARALGLAAPPPGSPYDFSLLP